MVEGGAKVEKLIEMVVPFRYPVTFTGKYQHIDVVYYLVTEVGGTKENQLTVHRFCRDSALVLPLTVSFSLS